MADLLALVPSGAKYSTLRSILSVYRTYFPEDYAKLGSSRVKDWVAEIESGTGRDADQIRDDFVKYVIGKDKAMSTFGISASQFDQLVLGKNEGGINFGEWDTGQKLNNVPGEPQVWKVGNKYMLAYMVPGTENDPVWMTWEAPSISDVQSWFGPDAEIKVDRTLSDTQYRRMGALDFGSTDEIPPGADNPFASWESDLKVQSQTQPWILDDDYSALMAMALVEGRALTDAELATTDWWKNHNADERRWMILYHGDPQSADQKLQTNRDAVREQIRAAGGGKEVSAEVINYMADQMSMGHWTSQYLSFQIRAITDKASGIALDKGLKKLDLSTVSQTQQGVDEVRDLLATWLGPSFGAWSEKEIQRVAGEIRNDPDAKQQFIETLKDQRMAFLPEYTDRNQSYAAIANTWKQWWIGQWGEMADEKDPLWMQVLRNNDIDQSAKLLRKEGLKRGVGKVLSDLSSQSVSLQDSERRPILNG